MGYLDYALIIIILICAGVGYNKGLIKMIYSLSSTIIGIFLAYFLYPQVSALLIKHTGLYNFIMNKAIQALNLKELARNAVTSQDQMQVIQNLKIPSFLKKILIDDNNPVVYNLLKATGVEEYIGGTIATIAINALAFLIVLLVVMILLNIIAQVLNLVSKLPVVHQLNKVGGLAIGLAQSVIFIWIVCILLSFVIALQGDEKLLLLVDQSPLVKIFYNNNLILKFISSLTKTLIK